jgi:septum site-determining protein MinC
MARNQFVILKGRKDGINIWLDEHADFEIIKDQLKAKVIGAKEFFSDADANIAFKGRALTDEEERSLLDIIIEETTLELSFVEHTEVKENIKPGELSAVANTGKAAAPGRKPDTAGRLRLSGSPLPVTEYPTAFCQSNLRSGQSIRYDGSVVVIGDVNPGAEIVANGNIIVMGSVKGMVHAGASGDDRCFVSALSLTPTQLRIANKITQILPEEKGRKTKTEQPYKPAYAYIENGQLYVVML